VASEPVAIAVVDFDPPAATFSDVQTLAANSCALAGCHVDGVEAGDLRWDRPAEKMWDELVNEESDAAPSLMLVRPDQPALSFLVHKLALAAPQAGARMPLGGPPLPAAQAQVVVRIRRRDLRIQLPGHQTLRAVRRAECVRVVPADDELARRSDAGSRADVLTRTAPGYLLRLYCLVT
jgi:hypothetical protein